MCNQKSRYVTVRESSLQELSNINPSFVNMCEADKFTYIMSSGDKDVCEITSRFVHKLVLVRGYLYENIAILDINMLKMQIWAACPHCPCNRSCLYCFYIHYQEYSHSQKLPTEGSFGAINDFFFKQ